MGYLRVMFIHSVYFWEKAGVPAAERERMVRDCRELLGAIPSVRKLYVGVAAGTPRAVVDNSYSVALTVVFDDVAGHDLYQPHELHSKFIERNKPMWEKVLIYDSVE